MLASRFISQSRKLCNCGVMLQNGFSAPSHVIIRQAPPSYNLHHIMADSFRTFHTRFSTALPFCWNKSRGEHLVMMTHARSCFSGSHLSSVHNDFMYGKELFNIIKSTFSEFEGPSHCWLNSVCNVDKFLDHEEIFLVLVNAYIQDDALIDHHDRILLIERVKFLQKRYPKLNVIGLQCANSAKSLVTHSEVLKTIMEEYITFPILLLDRNLFMVTDSVVYLFFEGSTSHAFYIKPGAAMGSIQKVTGELCSFLKEDIPVELSSYRPNQHAIIEEPNALASFRNLLLSYSGSLSVDEDGGRIFLSDSDHHRIIIADGDGKILDSIGSSPGFFDSDFEDAKLCRPAASFYNVPDGCLYFVDSENNAIRRADIERRFVETMYPVPSASGTWSRIIDMWSWILKSFGLARENEKTRELYFDPIASPWHLLNLGDEELIIISRSFAAAWIISMTTWKIKEDSKKSLRCMEI